MNMHDHQHTHTTDGPYLRHKHEHIHDHIEHFEDGAACLHYHDEHGVDTFEVPAHLREAQPVMAAATVAEVDPNAGV